MLCQQGEELGGESGEREITVLKKSVPLCTIIVIVINFKQPEGRLNH